MTDKYAVFGNPIAHSKSPQIHKLFAEQTQQNLVYEKQLVDEEQFQQAADNFFNAGGKGLNITVPFKLDAYSYVSKTTERARKAGAVNTLIKNSDGTVLGDNTDGFGMVSDIVDNAGWEISGKRVLILGAGGAVRGVLQPVLEKQPAQLVIANRTVAKALQLAKGFADLGKIQSCGFEDLEGLKFDLVINGTSASLSGDLPPLPEKLLAENANCYDMMYGAELTVFLQWAKAHNAKGLRDGLGMLVGQAGESFYQWRGVRPNTEVVIKALRENL